MFLPNIPLFDLSFVLGGVMIILTEVLFFLTAFFFSTGPLLRLFFYGIIIQSSFSAVFCAGSARYGVQEHHNTW